MKSLSLFHNQVDSMELQEFVQNPEIKFFPLKENLTESTFTRF